MLLIAMRNVSENSYSARKRANELKISFERGAFISVILYSCSKLFHLSNTTKESQLDINTFSNAYHQNNVIQLCFRVNCLHKIE